VAAGNYAEISIFDTGSGMTPEVLKRVFEPFFTTKEFGKGSGLGLSMVYGFAKQSGGHVTVYSEPGKGTVVHLYLPRAGEFAEDETGPTPESALRQQFAGLTILIVEDEERLRKVAVKMLSALGLNILEEADGAAALARLSEQPVDLLFADVLLKGDMDGIQLAEEARRLHPDLPILLTTGFAERALVEGHRCNGAGWIAKLYSKTELGQALAGLLRGKS
jgi:CheY-like chemotaxis protein